MVSSSKPMIGFIGGGNMAASLIGGMLQSGFEPNQLSVSDPLDENRQRFAKLGISTSIDNGEIAQKSEVLILAVKPQIMAEVAAALKDTLADNCLVISIAAGIPVAALQKWLGDGKPVVRCMPNTPALLKSGATGLFASPEVSNGQQKIAENILAAVGIVEWVANETLIDAVTALSGSGPAYYFLVMEMMEKVGVEMGLSSKTARNLTLQTALGAARMACESDVDPSELRRRVTSPAGTTERAVQSFLNNGMEELFRKAMQDCKIRAEEMANEFSQPVNHSKN